MTIIDISAADRGGKQFLDKQTEHDLAIRWRKHGDIAARDKLVMAHKPYADSVAREYAATYGVSASDLECHAFHGVLKGAADFDPGLGWRFNTYYRHKVRAEVQEACRKLVNGGLTPTQPKSESAEFAPAQRPGLTSFDEPLPGDEGEEAEATRHELVADPNALGEDDLLDAIHTDKLRGAILGLDLTLRDRCIAEALLDGVPPKAIAAELGISRQRVDQIWAKQIDRAAALLNTARRAKHIKPAPRWRLWHDRPPAELRFRIVKKIGKQSLDTHLDQVVPDWFRAQQWPSDRASFRTERRVEVVAGPALMPKVLSRWGYAHTSSSTGLQRRKVKGRLRIFVPATPVAARSRPENKRPRAMPPARNHVANRELLVCLGVDGSVSLNNTKAAFIREKCWSWKKPELADADCDRLFAQIPTDKIEAALQKLCAVDRQLIWKRYLRVPPMRVESIARGYEHLDDENKRDGKPYFKTLPALYRAVKRLHQAAQKVVPADNVVLLVTHAKQRAAA